MTKRCHEIDFTIINAGSGMEAVSIVLDPGEIVISEAGAMLWQDPDIEMRTALGDGSRPDQGFLGGLLSAGKRMIAGESAVVTHFKNNGKKRAEVVFGASTLGNMVGLDLNDVGGVIYLQRGAYICSSYGTEISIAFAGEPTGAFFGGEGLIFQKLIGDDKVVFQAGGSLVQKDLKAGESLIVDSGSLVGYTEGIRFTSQFSGGVRNALFSGEGLFNSKVEGVGQGGTVILQTLPFSRLCQNISQSLPPNR